MMKPIFLASVLLAATIPALAAPPPGLRDALAKWAAPASVSRFQFALVDLDGDESADAVVHVTDPAFCGNGGCLVLIFRNASGGYQLVGNSGFARQPMYLLKETRFGWHSLAAVVGLKEAGPTPIRYTGSAYTRTPYLRAQIELSPSIYEHVLEFEEVQ